MRKPLQAKPGIFFDSVQKLTTVAILLASSGCSTRGEQASPHTSSVIASESKAVVVRVQKVERRSITSTVDALGHCEALPDKLARITPAVEGQVMALLVREGQTVKAGQPLVQLDDTLAKADLAEKRAGRDSLVASLELLRSVPRAEEQAASKLAIEQTQVAVDQAAAMVERLKPLQARGEVSEQQLYDAEQALRNSQIQADSAKAQYEMLMLPPRKEAVSEAKSKILVSEQAIQAAEDRLALFTLCAPISGTLSSLTCHPGQTLAVGTPVGEIVDRQTVLVKVWLPAKQCQLVRTGQVASINVSAPNADEQNDLPGPSRQGTVIFVGDVADPQTGSVPVSIEVENADLALVIGETLSAEIAVSQAEESLTVPLAAVHDEGDGPVITVVRDRKSVILKPKFGATGKVWVAVQEPSLQAGEEVIVEGAYNLPEGTAVQIDNPGAHDKQP